MNENGFRRCILPLQKNLYAHAFAILRNENDAADCLQEAMSRLWQNRDRLDSLDNPAAYAVASVRNVALNMLSRARPLSLFGDSPPDVADDSLSPESALGVKDDERLMESLLGRLPESQRTVVELSAVAGLSNSEIREATGLSDDNVRVLLSRGRKRLRQLFLNFSSQWMEK